MARAKVVTKKTKGKKGKGKGKGDKVFAVPDLDPANDEPYQIPERFKSIVGPNLMLPKGSVKRVIKQHTDAKMIAADAVFVM